jgi:hypothetical protein
MGDWKSLFKYGIDSYDWKAIFECVGTFCSVVVEFSPRKLLLDTSFSSTFWIRRKNTQEKTKTEILDTCDISSLLLDDIEYYVWVLVL